MTRPRVLVVQPSLNGDGGSDQVAAWTLQALCGDHDVTLMTIGAVDFRRVDDFCETRLAGAVLEHRAVLPRLDAMGAVVPLRLALPRLALLMRAARRLDRERRFDCLLSTFNEMDLGRPCVQYVHYPWSRLPRPAQDAHWYTTLPGAMPLYHGLVRAVGGIDAARMWRNRSVANSRFVAGLIAGDCTVVHPPVPGTFAARPWSERADEVLAVGRLAPEKRLEEVVEIVRRVRERGHPLRLRIVGLPESRSYARQVERLASRSPGWVALETRASRPRLRQLLEGARYGIHAMRDEHFGIAVAEMLRAGCLVLAHRSGGPAEILSGIDELLYDDTADAAAKLCAAAESESRRCDLEARLAARRDLYSAGRFMEEMRRVVDSFIAEANAAPRR